MVKQSERSRGARRSLTRDEARKKTRAVNVPAGESDLQGYAVLAAFGQPAQRSERVIVRGVVGVAHASAADGPAYTLSPEPMTERPILDAQGRPRSVWSAILGASREAYRGLVRAVYPDCTTRGADEVIADTLLYQATQTRAFEALPGGGWRVWIDLGRRASVEVYP